MLEDYWIISQSSRTDGWAIQVEATGEVVAYVERPDRRKSIFHIVQHIVETHNANAVRRPIEPDLLAVTSPLDADGWPED